MGCNSSAPASGPISKPAGGKNVLNQCVEFHYFEGLNGRADPLRQMFEFHGQDYRKIGEDAPGWEAKKARGEGGEFGGGLPYAEITLAGKKHRMAQFGAILRMFCIKYGYYNPKDWKCALYNDMIVDTWCDVAGAMGGVLFGGEANKAANTEKFMALGKKFNMLIEKQLNHHQGKYAAGNKICMADFIMASWVGNFIMNDECPFSPGLKACVADTPKARTYFMCIYAEFPYLKTRGKTSAF